MSGSGSQAAKALRQLAKEPRTTNLSDEVSSPKEDELYGNNAMSDGGDGDFEVEEGEDAELSAQTHQQKILARLARREADEQIKLDQQRKKMIHQRRVKTQNDMFNKIVFDHSDKDDDDSIRGSSRDYYQYLPMKPGIEAYKWLVPIREDVVAGKKHHRPGLDALKLNMPDTVIYSDRYAGVAEIWLSTSSRDGCIITKRLSKKWISKYSQKAKTMIDTLSPPNAAIGPDLGLRRPVSVLKIGHWRNSESRNISRVIPEYSLPAALKSPTPTPGAVCIQNYVHSRGAHATTYRVVWNAYKPASGFLISSERKYQEREPSASVGAVNTHKGALVDDFLSTTHLASIENRSDDLIIPITVFELHGKAIAGPIEEIKKIVQYLERVKTSCGHMKFLSMACDFVKTIENNRDKWIFTQIKSFTVSNSCWDRCKKINISRNVSEFCIMLLSPLHCYNKNVSSLLYFL